MATDRRRGPKGGGDGKGSGRKQANASLEAQRRKQAAYMKLAGLGGAFFVAIAFLFQTQRGLTTGVPKIGLNETEVLKDIFFSGQPWLIQCIGPGISVDPSFSSAAPHLANVREPYTPVKTAMLPCGEKLPSGKTVYQRFKLNPSTSPLVALFVNGNKPQVVSQEALEMPSTLVKRVSEAAKLKVSEVSTPSSFGRACLSRYNKLCIIVLPYTPLSAAHNETIRAVASKHRTLQFTVINTNSVELSIEKLLPKLSEEQAAAPDQIRVVATRVFPDNSAQALAFRGGLAEEELTSWIADINSGEQELTMLNKKPSAGRRRRRDPDDEEGKAGRAERRKQRKADRAAAEEAIRRAEEEAMKTLTPEERAAREELIKQKRLEWERKRREQMEAEGQNLFDEDDDDEDDDEEDDDEDDAGDDVDGDDDMEEVAFDED